VDRNLEPKPLRSGLEELLFGFDERIRYVAILDQMGRTISGGMRPGLDSLEPKEEADKVDVQMALVSGMMKGGVVHLGKTNYVIIHREKLMLVAVPGNNDQTALISMKPDFPIERIPAIIDMVGSAP
jgi:hypothetical protein